MGGVYISCGKFSGDDKSGSAFQGLLAGIADLLSSAEAAEYRSQIFDPVISALTDHTLITPKIAAQLHPLLKRYSDRLRERLGNPDPWEAPGLDEKAGLDPTAAKWGEGLGWQYYCAHDLLRACEVSAETNEPIVVSFD
jgi:hypothetical protein